MATVHRALDLSTSSFVAVKRLLHANPGDVERFAREAEIMQAIDHPAIVKWITHGQLPGGAMYLVMEWLQGEDLRKRTQRSRLELADTIALGARVAGALGALHERGIVHRDIKPANLFLCEGSARKTKIIDFGVARWSAAPRSLTHRGALVGTPGFMAPEQARGEQNVDGRADLFALGCVLFLCLTGERAFPGERAVAVLAKVVLCDVVPVRTLAPTVPESLDRLVARLLAKDPGQRPQKADEVAEELDYIARTLGQQAPAAPESRPPRRVLTSSEQRFVTVLLAGARLPSSSTAPQLSDEDSTPSVSPAGAQMLSAAVDQVASPGAAAAIAAAHDASVNRLADGSWLVHIVGAGVATEHAQRMARCALALRSQLPFAPMGLATGRGWLEGDRPVGDAIERAAQLLRAAQRVPSPEPPPLFIDEPTEALTLGHFDVVEAHGGRTLVRERPFDPVRRHLLGKPQPCMGRDRELDTLLSALDLTISQESPRAFVVVGAAGLGKSRLRAEVEQAIDERGRRVAAAEGPPAAEMWIGRGDPLRAGAPFGMLRAVLRGALRLRDGDPLDVQRGHIAARVRVSVAPDDRERVSAFLGEIAGVPFPDVETTAVRTARRDPMLLGDQTRRAFADFVEAECRLRPVVIVLEDLHWGDGPTIEYIDAALARPKVPLFVLALARPEIHARFPGLWKARDTTHLSLLPLGRKACEAIVMHALGEGADPDRVAAIARRSAGNPFFLEELIRAEADGRSDAPETVLSVVEARLTGLAPAARRVLRAASILGQVFWAGAVSALVGKMSVGERDVLLAELVKAEWISPRTAGARFAGEREYIFRNAILQEAAYGTLTEEDRTIGHGLAAEWLEHAGERESALLAEHWARSGDRDRAAAAHLRAAMQAVESNDWERAVHHASEAEKLGAAGEALGAAALTRAEACLWRGAFAEGDAHVERALELLPRGSERWFTAARCAAEVWPRTRPDAPLAALCDSLCDEWSPDKMTAPQITAMLRVAIELLRLGDIQRAEHLASRVEPVAHALEDDPATLAHGRMLRAERALFDQDFGQFLVLTTAVVEAFEKAGDIRRACTARVRAGYAATCLGRFDLAEALLREALVDAERLRLEVVRAHALHHLGRALSLQDRHGEALAIEREAMAVAQTHGDRRMVGTCHIYLAEILCALGDLADAESEARMAIEDLTRVPPLLPYARGSLAEVLLAAERPAEARLEATEGMRIMEELGGRIEGGEALLRIVYVESLVATGQLVAARRELDAAQRRLLMRAGRLLDPDTRAAFLGNVSEHERTLELARAWAEQATVFE